MVMLWKYDTDKEQILDEVYNEYFMEKDIWDMLDIAREEKIPEEKRADEFFKRIYGDTSYHRVYHRRTDPIYD